MHFHTHYALYNRAYFVDLILWLVDYCTYSNGMYDPI